MSRREALARRVQALRQRPALRHVLTLVTGATAAQALVFLARPVLTRLYSPEAFGLLSVFVAPAYLMTVLATLRYEDAVAVPARDRDGAGLVVLAVVASLALALLLALAVPFREALAGALDAPELAPLLPLVPVVVASLGVAAAAQAWLARVEAFRVLALAAVVQSLAVVGVQAALFRRGTEGLITGTVVGAVGFAGILLVAAWRSGIGDRVRSADIGALARRYHRFPLFGIPASGLIQLAARLPPLVLIVAFGPAVVGYFSVAMASVGVPVGLVADSVGHVFYVRGAEAERDGRLGPLVERVHARLMAFAAFPVLAVALFGPDLFAAVFGAPWREAGLYARVLAPWLLLGAVAAPLTRAFDVTERQRAEFGTGLVTAVLVVGALLVGTRLDAPVAALAVLAGGGAVARIVQIATVLRISNASLVRGAVDLGGSLVRSALWLVPGALGLWAGGLRIGLVAAALGAVGYAWTVLRPLRATTDPVA